MRRTQPNVKPVLQMVLDGEPLSAAEIREMALRHILSSQDPMQTLPERISEHLLKIYGLLMGRTGAPALSMEEGRKLLKQNFAMALAQQLKISIKEAESYWTWPPGLPKTNVGFHRDFLVQLGAALGIVVAGQMSEKISKN